LFEPNVDSTDVQYDLRVCHREHIADGIALRRRWGYGCKGCDTAAYLSANNVRGVTVVIPVSVALSKTMGQCAGSGDAKCDGRYQARNVCTSLSAGEDLCDSPVGGYLRKDLVHEDIKAALRPAMQPECREAVTGDTRHPGNVVGGKRCGGRKAEVFERRIVDVSVAVSAKVPLCLASRKLGSITNSASPLRPMSAPSTNSKRCSVSSLSVLDKVSLAVR
jgi:hypothetical protein